MKLWFQLGAIWRKKRLERAMVEEMQAHLDGLTERNIAAGMSPRAAADAARRTFGGVEQIKERARDERRWPWLEETLQDLRYAARALRKNPGFTITAVMTLALGIGVNTALFAVYDIAVLRPLPSREPDELVEIRGRNERVRGNRSWRFSYPDYLDYCAGTQAFSDLVAVADIAVQFPEEIVPLAGSPLQSTAGRVSLQTVSGNYFSALGANIFLGRDFLPEEAGVHAGRPVMVLSHLFWKAHFGADAAVLGKTLTTLDGNGSSRTIYTIIGVAQPDFVGQSVVPPAGWIPLTANPAALNKRSGYYFSLIGRMRAGISMSQAKADLDAIARGLADLYPEAQTNAVALSPGMRLFDPSLSPGAAVAMSPVLLGFALVLVIACLNVANLLLARGVTRQHEIGVRLALGAGRGRIVRQLFTENLVLCGLGAGAALLLAIWTLQALQPIAMSMLADEIQARNFLSMIEIGLDRRIVGFGALLAIVAGLTAGLAPALHSVQREGLFALTREGAVFGRKMTPSRIRGLLLIGQVAVCLTMLAVSGMMSGKLLRTRAAETGFSTDQVFELRSAALSGARNTLADDPLAAVETLRTIPGVASAGLVSATPLRKPGKNVAGWIHVKTANHDPEQIGYNRISAGFFEAFTVPLKSGRTFTPSEVASGEAMVVVSEFAARALWPGQEAVGQILSVDVATLERRAGQTAEEENRIYREFAVIGVARDIRGDWSRNTAEKLLWFPLPAKGASASLFVKLQAEATSVRESVEAAAQAAGVPVQFQDRLSAIVDRGLGPYRAFAWVGGALTCLSLVLATVGLYGVMSFGVNQRVREIGVRMALGATAERVTLLFLRQGMRLVAWGLGFGLVGGVAFMTLLNTALPGADFVGSLAFRCGVFTVMTIFLAGVAFLACWLPSRRAARVDPMIALRVE
ncbi:MAG: ADOP family duplicated permease [Opitutaceae bacterium]